MNDLRWTVSVALVACFILPPAGMPGPANAQAQSGTTTDSATAVQQGAAADPADGTQPAPATDPAAKPPLSGNDGPKNADSNSDAAQGQQSPLVDPSVVFQGPPAPTYTQGFTRIPLRLAAFGAGLVVGTPVAMFRKSAQGVKDVTMYMTDGDQHPLKVGVFGAVFGLPFGTWSGAVDGALWSLSNSWNYSYEKPFSRESFSLGQ